MSTWSINPDDGVLTELGRSDLMSNVGPTAVDPDGTYLHAAQVSDMAVTSFSVAADGVLTELETINVGHRPVYLSVDATGQWLLGASFGGDLIRVYAIEGDGTLVETPVVALDVQARPHAIVLDPTNQFVLVPHRDSNLTEQYLFDENTGGLTANAVPSVAAPGGAGPRHLVFSPDGDHAYLGNEFDSTVSHYTFDSVSGTLALVDTVSTLPRQVDNTVADIHITPDGQNVYVSNRGHDSIAIFSVGPGGGLAANGHAPTEPRPRDFHLTPDGNYLYAAGQDSGMLASYTIEADGSLTAGATYDVGEGASWVLTTRLPER